ncbi:MAG: transcriptional regulator [Acidobacteriota bacterium]|nr:transcriptional regulator [Acidobacteriota bacterium]
MIKNTKKTLGEFLKDLRLIRKLTLRDVGGKTGISNGYISQVENGQIKRPSPNFLHKMSEALDYSYELLMERAGYVAPKSTSRSKTTNPASTDQAKAFAIFSTIKDLTEEEAEVLLEFLNWRRSRPGKQS